MDRRPLTALLALGLAASVPAGANAATPNELLAQSGAGGLSERASSEGDLFAQTSDTGGLSSRSTTEPSESSGSETSSRSGGTAATASALPYTGSDPRLLLALGMAAVLTGAGLRLRTGDARDF